MRCRARTTTLGNNVQSMNENHDHILDHIQIKVDKLTTKIRKRAREEATRPVTRVYDVVQEIASDPDMYAFNQC